MDTHQKHDEEHRLDRQEKQKQERESEKRFSQPGPMIRPIWFLMAGVALVLSIIALWTVL